MERDRIWTTTYYSASGYTGGEIKDRKGKFVDYNYTDPYKTLDFVLSKCALSKLRGPFRDVEKTPERNDENTLVFIMPRDVKIKLDRIDSGEINFESRGVRVKVVEAKVEVFHSGSTEPKYIRELLGTANLSSPHRVSFNLDELDTVDFRRNRPKREIVYEER